MLLALALPALPIGCSADEKPPAPSPPAPARQPEPRAHLKEVRGDVKLKRATGDEWLRRQGGAAPLRERQGAHRRGRERARRVRQRRHGEPGRGRADRHRRDAAPPRPGAHGPHRAQGRRWTRRWRRRPPSPCPCPRRPPPSRPEGRSCSDEQRPLPACLARGHAPRSARSVVSERETLSQVAERALGDPKGASELRALNGLTSDTVPAGTTLKLPPAEDRERARSALETARTRGGPGGSQCRPARGGLRQAAGGGGALPGRRLWGRGEDGGQRVGPALSRRRAALDVPGEGGRRTAPPPSPCRRGRRCGWRPRTRPSR